MGRGLGCAGGGVGCASRGRADPGKLCQIDLGQTRHQAFCAPFGIFKALGTDKVGFELPPRSPFLFLSGGQASLPFLPSFLCSLASCPKADLSPLISADLAACFRVLEGQLISEAASFSTGDELQSDKPLKARPRSLPTPTCACHGAPEGAAAPLWSFRGSC